MHFNRYFQVDPARETGFHSVDSAKNNNWKKTVFVSFFVSLFLSVFFLFYTAADYHLPEHKRQRDKIRFLDKNPLTNAIIGNSDYYCVACKTTQVKIFDLNTIHLLTNNNNIDFVLQKSQKYYLNRNIYWK